MYESLVFAIAGLSSITGVIAGYLFNGKKIIGFFNKGLLKNINTNNKNTNNEKNTQELERLFKTEKEIKEELKIFQYEKSLLAFSIEKILEEYKNKRIDIYERDRLLHKYRQELNIYNEKIIEIQSKLDLTSLMNLRQNLMNVIENRVVEIDNKIKEINIKLGNEYSNINNIKNLGEKNEIRKNIKDDEEKDLIKNKIHEKKDLVENNEIKKLKNEVADALKDLDTSSGSQIEKQKKTKITIVSDVIKDIKNNNKIEKNDNKKRISIIGNDIKNISKYEEKEKILNKSTEYPLSNILSSRYNKIKKKSDTDDNKSLTNSGTRRDPLNRIR